MSREKRITLSKSSKSDVDLLAFRIWNALDQAKKNFDLSEEEWRNILGLSPKKYTSFKNRTKDISVLTVLRAATYLGLSFSGLLEGEVKIDPKKTNQHSAYESQ